VEADNAIAPYANEPADERFYCEGRLTRGAVTTTWALILLFTLLPLLAPLAVLFVNPSGFFGTLYYALIFVFSMNVVVAPLHIILCRHTWYIDADSKGVFLYRVIGKKRIPWHKIEQINYCGHRHIVRDIVVNGVAEPIPTCINSQVLTRIVEKCAKAEQKQCHRDFQANPLKVASAISPAHRLGLISMGTLLAMTVIATAATGMRMDSMFHLITFVCVIPGSLLLHAFTNAKRSTAVRITQRGLGIQTLIGHFEIAWSEFTNIEVDEADKIIRLDSAKRRLLLGPELSNYEQLARQIEAKSREMAKARILKQEQAWEQKHVVAAVLDLKDEEIFTIQPS
jgi:hypothetical protein